MEVATAFVTLLPSAKGFGRNLQGAIGGDVTKAGKQGGHAYGMGMSSGIGAIAGKVFAPLAAAMAGVKVLEFFKEGVQGASDLREAGSAVGVIFGDGAAQVQAFAAKAVTALGQTKLQALQAAGTFGTFGKAAGLTGKDLAKFSTGFTTLASDLASFKNTSPEQAVDALGAALRGESEPLRAYGILLDDATLRQEALKQGLIKTTKQALTPAQKVLAAQAAIYAQTSDAQGDFARTSGGLANQQRILGAQWTELKNTLGAGFLPVVTAVTSELNSAMGPAIEAAGPFVTRLSDGFASLFSSVGKGKGALTPLIDGFKSFAGTAGPALASLGGPLKAFASSLLPVFQKLGTNIVGVLGPAFRQIGDIVANKFVPAVKAILPILQPVAKFLLETLGGAITGALSGAMKVIQGVLTAVSGLVSFIANVFKGQWGAAWQGIKDVVAGVFKAILGAAQVWMNVGLLKVFRLGVTALKGLWTKGLDLLKAGASSAWSAIQRLFLGALRGIASGIVGAVRGYLGLWRGLFSSFLSILRNGWSVARSAFGGALAAVRTILTQAISAYLRFWSGLFTKMIGAVRSAATKIGSAFSGIQGKITSALSGAGRWLADTGRNIVQGLIDGIRGMAGKVVDALLGLIPAPLRKFADRLGIASPSKVFAEFGRNIGQGLVVGVDATQSDVTRSVANLADSARNAVGRSRWATPLNATTASDMRAGIAFYGPVTTTDVVELGRQITTRQRDALALVGGMEV